MKAQNLFLVILTLGLVLTFSSCSEDPMGLDDIEPTTVVDNGDTVYVDSTIINPLHMSEIFENANFQETTSELMESFKNDVSTLADSMFQKQWLTFFRDSITNESYVISMFGFLKENDPYNRLYISFDFFRYQIERNVVSNSWVEITEYNEKSYKTTYTNDSLVFSFNEEYDNIYRDGLYFEDVNIEGNIITTNDELFGKISDPLSINIKEIGENNDYVVTELTYNGISTTLYFIKDSLLGKYRPEGNKESNFFYNAMKIATYNNVVAETCSLLTNELEFKESNNNIFTY
ncbi:MAG: hypothetical protein ACOC1K_05885 [Nanoarchaeota archaeon]